MIRSLRVLVAGCLMAAWLAGTISTGQAAEAAAEDAAAALRRFNTEMRSVYADSRAALQAETRPVILVGLNEVTLLTADGGRDTKRYTPAVYHHLKAVSHIVLGLIGAAAPALDDRLEGRAWGESARTVRAAIAALLPHLDGLAFSAAQAERQRTLLSAVQAYLDARLEDESLDRAGLIALLTRIKPLWLANADDAARAQLDGLAAAVAPWRARLSAEDWAALYVLIPGPRMPRPQNLHVGFFTRLLGEGQEGRRVLYTENLYAEDRVLNQLGVIVIDRFLSELVFGDPYRMDVDLLGYAARAYLDERLPLGP